MSGSLSEFNEKFNSQLNDFNKLIENDIEKCNKKATDMDKENKEGKSKTHHKHLSKTTFGKADDSVQRRMDCFFRRLWNDKHKDFHGFDGSILREHRHRHHHHGGKVSSSSSPISSHTNLHNTNTTLDNTIFSTAIKQGKELEKLKNFSDIYVTNYNLPTKKLDLSADIRNKLIEQFVQSDTKNDPNYQGTVKSIYVKEIEKKLKTAINFCYETNKQSINKSIAHDQLFGISDKSEHRFEGKGKTYSYYNLYLDSFIHSRKFNNKDLLDVIDEINIYKKNAFETEGELLSEDLFNNEIYKQLFCFAWKKAKLLAVTQIIVNKKINGQAGGDPSDNVNSNEMLELYNDPKALGEHTKRNKTCNLLFLTFSVILMVFASVLAYQTWNNLYYVYNEIYYAGAATDLYGDLNENTAEATFSITSFFQFFKDFFMGTVINNIKNLEDEALNNARSLFDETCKNLRETNQDIWDRGWAVGIVEYTTGYGKILLEDRAYENAVYQARLSFEQQVHDTTLRFKGYGAAIGSVYICSWICVNMFATVPVCILHTLYPQLVDPSMVYRSISSLTIASGGASSTASSFNLLGISTCLGATGDSFRTLSLAISYVRNPELIALRKAKNDENLIKNGGGNKKKYLKNKTRKNKKVR